MRYGVSFYRLSLPVVFSFSFVSPTVTRACLRPDVKRSKVRRVEDDACERLPESRRISGVVDRKRRPEDLRNCLLSVLNLLLSPRAARNLCIALGAFPARCIAASSAR